MYTRFSTFKQPFKCLSASLLNSLISCLLYLFQRQRFALTWTGNVPRRAVEGVSEEGERKDRLSPIEDKCANRDDV